MRIHLQTLSLLAATCCLLLAGCGGYSVAPVSGTLTVNGEPVGGIKLVFYPKGGEDNPNPGPFSSGKTDESGKFTLTTRDGAAGAVVGDHRVCIEMGDGDSGSEEELGEAQSMLEEATADGDKAGAAAAKKEVDRLMRKMGKMAKIPAQYRDGSAITVVSIPSNGSSDLRIEL